MIHDVAVTVAQLAVIVTGLTAIGVAGWRVLRFVRKSVHAFDIVIHELQPNHGTSIRDAVDRMEKRQIADGERLLRLEEFAKSVELRDVGE